MKRLFLVIILLFNFNVVIAKDIDFSLNAVPLPQALTLLYDQVFNCSFMLEPVLNDDKRLVSFHITKEVDERAFIKRYLRNMNIAISTIEGVDYIHSFTPEVKRSFFSYKPCFMSTEYLIKMLSSKWSGQFDTKSSFVNDGGDMLVFYGEDKEILSLKNILSLIDVKPAEVQITAYVFEVQTSQKDGSGIQLAAKLLSNEFSINVGQLSSFDNFLKFNFKSIDLLSEFFSTDTRFHVVSSPHLRVKNGVSASFSVGAEVPVLGSISYTKSRSTQSVEYKSSGVIFNVSPSILNEVISLTIDQQLSDFVKTNTGVNNTPTLIKRQIKTEIVLNDGDIVVLGGLSESKDNVAKTGFSFLSKPFTIGQSSEKSRTDLIVLLQVHRVK